MKKIKLFSSLLVISTFSLFSGDLTITYKAQVKAMKLLPSVSATTVEYHSSHHKRVNNQKSQIDIIYDYNDFTRYIIYHKKKTISKATLDDMIKVLEIVAQAHKESPDLFADLREEIGNTSKITEKKDGVEAILNRKCDKWIISMGKYNAKISVDPDLAPPIPQVGKVAMLNDFAPYSTMQGYSDTIGKMNVLVAKYGIPLKSNVVMPLGSRTLTTSKEAIKIVEGTIPASVFALPDGYALEDGGKKIIDQATEMIMTMPRSVVTGR